MKPAVTVWLMAFCLSLGMSIGVMAPVSGYVSPDGSHVGIYVGPVSIEHDAARGWWHVAVWACIEGQYDRWGCPA